VGFFDSRHIAAERGAHGPLIERLKHGNLRPALQENVVAMSHDREHQMSMPSMPHTRSRRLQSQGDHLDRRHRGTAGVVTMLGSRAITSTLQLRTKRSYCNEATMPGTITKPRHRSFQASDAQPDEGICSQGWKRPPMRDRGKGIPDESTSTAVKAAETAERCGGAVKQKARSIPRKATKANARPTVRLRRAGLQVGRGALLARHPDAQPGVCICRPGRRPSRLAWLH